MSLTGITAVRPNDLRTFTVLCRHEGIDVPPPVVRALELLDVATKHERLAPPTSVLEMTDDEAREWITAASIRQHEGYAGSTKGLRPGLRDFEDTVLLEVSEAALPYLDDIVRTLQPRFDEIAAPIMHAAQTFGFRRETDPGTVIDMADEAASAAYRGARDAIGRIAPIARLRILISKTFNLGPAAEEFEDFGRRGPSRRNSGIDYSVAFAAGDGWGYDGEYYVDGRVGNVHLDWMKLAAQGLRLNTPSEVDAKLHPERAD